MTRCFVQFVGASSDSVRLYIRDNLCILFARVDVIILKFRFSNVLKLAGVFESIVVD